MSRDRYDNQRWRRLSASIRRERPICETPGCDMPSAEVDHIDGLGPSGPRGYDPANLRALCKPCHSRKTARTTPGGWRTSTQPRRRPATPHPGLLTTENDR